MKHALLGATSAIALAIAVPASAGGGGGPVGPTITYVPNSMIQSVIKRGPWPLHEDDKRFKHDASGIVPPPTQTMPPYVGTGTPYAGDCGTDGRPTTNHDTSLMQPYYFPFVRRRGDVLEGFFDYRPRNQQEAVVTATSEDWGVSWEFTGEALQLNPYCPADPTDPDNLAITVNGISVPYATPTGNNAADNGLGHPVALTVNGVERLYQLNRANGFIDSDQLVVNQLSSDHEDGPLSRLPKLGYVSPLASGGYPTLTTTVKTKNLQNPDAIMGAVAMAGMTTVIYVEKQLGADTSFPASQICPKTPAFALTTLINGKPRKANDDVTTVRVATTTDGISFTDVGAATGLFDPTTVALNGTRWLGSGSIIPLADGRYGMFFGAGNCLDNDSDGFHYIGYAETVNVVHTPSDLLAWNVFHALDNPILSTDTVTDPSGPRPYPLNAPIVNITGADALTAAQVAPFTPPVPASPFVVPLRGYDSNFFSGRVYDPQAIYTNDTTLTIVFAGYNTPQPSNNLGDYRTIGRFQLNVPKGYFKRPSEGHDHDPE